MSKHTYTIGDHVKFGNRNLIICGIEKETPRQPAVYDLCDEHENPFGSVFAEQISPINARHTTPYIKNVRRVNVDTSPQRGGKRATRRNKLRKKRRKTNRRR